MNQELSSVTLHGQATQQHLTTRESIVVELFKKSGYEDAINYVKAQLNILSKHQSVFASFYYSLPHSLRHAITHLTNLKFGFGGHNSDKVKAVLQELYGDGASAYYRHIESILFKTDFSNSYYTKYHTILNGININMTCGNGDKFIGKIVNGLYKGKLIRVNGTEFIGLFACSGSPKNGSGTIKITNQVSLDGCIFNGELRDYLPFKGSMTFPNQTIFTGNYNLYGYPKHGIVKFANNIVFEGSIDVIATIMRPHRILHVSMFIDKGKMTYPNGKSFQGNFNNDQPFKGIMTYANSNTFNGLFKYGNPYKGTFKSGVNETKIENGISVDGSHIIFNEQLISVAAVEQKKSTFINWIKRQIKQLNPEEDSFKVLCTLGSKELRVNLDTVSFDPPANFTNIIIIDMDSHFLIQDAATHLAWFKTNKTLPINKNPAKLGINYWTEDQFIDLLNLNKWSSPVEDGSPGSVAKIK